MGKIKIHEIAKEVGLTSKEVIKIANDLGINVTSHLSAVDDEQADAIRKNTSKVDGTATAKNADKKEKASSKQVNSKEEKAAKKEESKEEKSSSKANKKEATSSNAKKNETPVIIRREVIISEEEKSSQTNNRTQEQSKKGIGFVERSNNKDYNIVYRNKQTKPLTVSELFGLKPKEEPKQEESKEIEQEEVKPVEVEKEKPVETTQEKAEKVVETKPEVVKENKPQNRNFDNKNNNFRNNNNRNQNYRNNNFKNNNGNQNFRNNQNGERNNRNGQNANFRNNQNGRFNNGRRPLDEKGIDKNIKNIMTIEMPEKEAQRDYSSKAIDKQKANNRYEDKTNKKANKSRRNNQFDEFDSGKLKDLKQVDSLSNMFTEQDGGMLEYYDLTTARGKRNKKKAQKGDEERNKQKIFELKEITIPENITVKDLAQEMKKTTAEVIKKLFGLGIMATINNTVDFDTAYLVASEFGITANKKTEVKEEDILFDDTEDSPEELEPRPPVVVVMGHVDHGKTSLLDAIRSTNVIEGEAGGITQHIGAYKVNVNGREITFLDTPGHEAFTSMRARGAQITDIAILVVAADDGVMPQTIEAINHAKAAEIPIIVAVNKIDLPGANVEKIKQELMEYELVPEEWGGDTIFVPISAKKHINIENLLEMVLLVADMKELKANPRKQAKGTVIEARLDKAKGPIASMLVQRGTLDVGDTIVVGTSIGRIRAMKNDKGQKIKKAGPSTPVEIMGITNVPEAGDIFYEVKDEKMAKHLIERRKRQEREAAIAEQSKVTLSNLFEKMESENLKQLDIIVKADVQGTAQALKQSLEKLSNEEVKVRVIHSAVGAVTESDVQLAKAAKAIIIAFNVRPNTTAKDMAEKDSVEIKQYSVIYNAIEDVEAAMKGMLAPVYEEKVIGNVEVRQTFKVSNVGTIAGAYVLDGRVERNAGVRVIRDNVVIHEGKLASLKRFKDDVKEVTKGFECGIQIEKYNDIKEGDIIEVYVMEEVAR